MFFWSRGIIIQSGTPCHHSRGSFTNSVNNSKNNSSSHQATRTLGSKCFIWEMFKCLLLILCKYCQNVGAGNEIEKAGPERVFFGFLSICVFCWWVGGRTRPVHVLCHHNNPAPKGGKVGFKHSDSKSPPEGPW